MRPTREMRPRGILRSGLGGAIIGTGGGTEEGEHVLVIEGGRDQAFAHGNLGTTENIDPTDGNVHTGTLTADCTITLLGPDTTRVSAVSTLEIYLTEDGTGGWTPTFAASAGSIVWPDGVTPEHDTTADTLTRYVFETIDNGTIWYGLQVGAGGSSLTIEDEGTPLATDATTLDFVGSPVDATGTGAVKTIQIRSNEPVTYNPGSGPDLVWEGDDLVMEWVD